MKKEEEEEELEERRRRMPNHDFFTSRGAYVLALYSDVIHLFDWKSAVEQGGGI